MKTLTIAGNTVGLTADEVKALAVAEMMAETAMGTKDPEAVKLMLVKMLVEASKSVTMGFRRMPPGKPVTLDIRNPDPLSR